MAYIVGILTENEIAVLESRGWEMEDPPPSLMPHIDEGEEPVRMKMVFVDNDMFSIMSGPEWDKTNYHPEKLRFPREEPDPLKEL